MRCDDGNDGGDDDDVAKILLLSFPLSLSLSVIFLSLYFSLPDFPLLSVVSGTQSEIQIAP